MATDLERFVEADGRAELVKDVRKKIDAEGVTYVYYQFISVTGRVMGKGVPAPHWETMAQKGFQLVYGSTANLFTDRHGGYIGYGPEAWELVGIPEPETFEVLPWDNRVARVWCTCFRNREDRDGPGAFLTSDCRGNLRRIQEEFEGRTGHAPPRRDGARDDVAPAEPRRHAFRRGEDEALLLPHRPVLRAPADHPQDGRVRAEARPRHDPGRPRGRTRSDRAQLRLRPRGEDGGQPLHVPSDREAGRPRGRRVSVLHAQALHGRVGERLPHEHLPLEGRRERLPTGRGRRAHAEPDRAQRRRRHPRAPACAHMRDGIDRELLQALLGDRVLGAGLRRLGVPEPDDRASDLVARPLRVPVGRLGRQPVPRPRRADQGHGRRHPTQARSRPSPRSRTSTRRSRPARP